MTATADSLPDLVSLKVEVAGHVAEVTLLGPSKGNAMGPDFWRELPLVFRTLDADPQVRAVVLTGSGAHFSYGLDLPAMMGDWAPMLGGDSLAGPRTAFLDQVRSLQAAVSSIGRDSRRAGAGAGSGSIRVALLAGLMSHRPPRVAVTYVQENIP